MSVSDRDSPSTTVRSGTPRARLWVSKVEIADLLPVGYEGRGARFNPIRYQAALAGTGNGGMARVSLGSW